MDMKIGNHKKVVIGGVTIVVACIGLFAYSKFSQTEEEGPTNEGWVVTSFPNEDYLESEDGTTGWLEVSDEVKFYYDKDSKAVTGWKDIEENEYYFLDSGQMAIGPVVMDDGSVRVFDIDGSLYNGTMYSGSYIVNVVDGVLELEEGYTASVIAAHPGTDSRVLMIMDPSGNTMWMSRSGVELSN